ncbi:MAG: phosphatase PAP2 family protein [Lyngbya sp.]|nr:phosphatase PAP2 family protein [Lyngbya sp.]
MKQKTKKITSRILTLLFSLVSSGLILSALSLWVFFEIAEEVLEQETKALDTAILQHFQSWHTPLLNQIFIGVTFLGNPNFLILFTLVVSLILIHYKQKAKLGILAIASGGAMGLNYWLKVLFSRSRPQLWQQIVDVNFKSFPSGHAMISLVVYGIVSYYLITQFQASSKIIITLTSLLIFLIGLSRLYLGVHWPTDILAGYAAGLVWLTACIFSLKVAEKRGNLGS